MYAQALALPPGWIDASALVEIDRRVAAIAPVSARSILADAWVFLFALCALVEDADLTVDEVALRLRQLAGCAAGRPSPELAFDPVAIFACTLAERLHGPAWAAELNKVVTALLAERLAGGGVNGARSAAERGKAFAPAIETASWMLLDDALPAAA